MKFVKIVKKEIKGIPHYLQDILNDKDCEELDPDSGSIHTGNPIMFPEQTGTGKKSQPPTSLNLPAIGENFQDFNFRNFANFTID